MRAEAFNIRTASDDSCGGGLGTRLGGATKDSILGGTYNVSAPPPPPPLGGAGPGDQTQFTMGSYYIGYLERGITSLEQ